MMIESLFSVEYIEIKANNELAIDEFIEMDGDKYYYSKPLKSVFIHKNKNEMFLILDCLGLGSEEIKNFISIWEYKVLAYVNFGTKLSEHKPYLKFNTSMIIQTSKSVDSSIKYEMEKSKKICRKIFVGVDDGKLIDSDKTILPFYFDFEEDILSKEEVLIENTLNDVTGKCFWRNFGK